jgi:hypothetical protein
MIAGPNSAIQPSSGLASCLPLPGALRVRQIGCDRLLIAALSSTPFLRSFLTLKFSSSPSAGSADS